MKRYRLYLINIETGERQEALAKSADMLSAREANRAIQASKGQKWEYRKEEVGLNKWR
jgi:hypothetical protein